MKGIILAGGSGTRLAPMTKVVSKQLLPIYDKPMIYYPLSTLMLAGIREILLITTPADSPRFQELLGDGGQFGIRLSYAVQTEPKGVAEALLIGEEFLGGESCALILGDNLFYGSWFQRNLHEAAQNAAEHCATIFCYYVRDPERFGIAELDEEKNVISVEEKPAAPRSNLCITGLYFYDGRAPELARRLKPSGRGELEITDLNRLYLEQGSLRARVLGRGFAWMDTGTVEALMRAASFVEAVQIRQGVVISAPEEIAYYAKWISRETLLLAAEQYQNSPYGLHLADVARGKFMY